MTRARIFTVRVRLAGVEAERRFIARSSFDAFIAALDELSRDCPDCTDFRIEVLPA
jgi:hypothetical protein